MRPLLLPYVTHLKIVLILSLLLNFSLIPLPKHFEAYLARDEVHCPNCFDNQQAACLEFYGQLTEVDELQRILVALNKFNKRDILWLKLNSTTILAKSYGSSQKSPITTATNNWQLRTTAGFQICNSSVRRFLEHFKQLGHPISTTLCYMHVNVTPLLMPILESAYLPVPHTYAACGFTLFQAYAGHTLHHYYASHLSLRLELAKQLLELARKFSYGYEKFRIYITDFSADNFAYDERAEKLFLIDLDTIFMVDAAETMATKHRRHEVIPTNCTFSYVPEKICNTDISDMNLYAACQLLRENLCGVRDAGFLKPHEMTAQLRDLLDRCVECPAADCDERFTVANDIIRYIERLLTNGS